MVRIVLFIILFIIIARAFWRVIDNVIQAASGAAPGGGPPLQNAKMVRDPVCGTFLLPDRALSVSDARGRAYFCSTACRDKYAAAQREPAGKRPA
jgi:YHS domain-containing protein